MKFLSNFFSGVAVLFFLGGNFSGNAADISILVGSGGDHFVPATTNIAVNDRVIWTWAGVNHNVTSTSTPQAWTASPTKSSGTFSNTFTASGSYPYECSIHVGFGMVGSITVVAPPAPPAVAITNPISGTIFIAPANVTVQAFATNNDNTVTSVQFRVGANILTNDNAAPFSAVTNNLAAGSYMLTAIASDSHGLSATNSLNIIVDTRPSVTITSPANNMTFSAPANVTIQASASDVDAGDGVTNLQFLVGSNILTNDNAAPFSGITNNLATGSYTLSAIAFDTNGVKNTNFISISVVTPVTVTMTNASKFSGTNFQFNYPANVGLNYVVQRSTNLINWISLVTNTAASNPVVFVDAHATNNPNYYRVGRMPNP